ncbi:hypothetical protein D3C81_839980 [compost metagenome]
MEIEEPLTDEITNFLSVEYVVAEHCDPFGAAAADQFPDQIGALQMPSMQAQHSNIATSICCSIQNTAIDFPTCYA